MKSESSVNFYQQQQKISYDGGVLQHTEQNHRTNLGQTMKLFIVTKKSLKIKEFPKTSKGCHGSTYLFKLIAVKKQIAMLLDIVHFKDRHGSTYFFTLIAVQRQIAMLVNIVHNKDCHGSTYLSTLVAVKKQIAMLLNTVHFKGCHGSTYLFTLIAGKKQIAKLFP